MPLIARWTRPLRVAVFRARAGSRAPSRADLWVHGASLGEIAAAASLLRLVEDLAVHVTSGTPEGLARAEALALGRARGAGPVTRAGARRILDAVRPRALWLVESELWPGVLAAAADAGVPVAVVGARMSARSHARYGTPLLRGWFARLAALVTRFIAADGVTAERLLDLGVARGRVHVGGRIKVPEAPDPDAAIATLMRRLAPGRSWIVGGSTHPGEEEALLATGAGPLMLAPRHLERLGEVEHLIRRAGRRPVLRSAEPRALAGDEVLLLDTHGELAAAYQRARWTLVGGSLSHGAHDLLEPLVAGSGLLCGPRLGLQAEEARVLRRAGALRSFTGDVPEAAPADLDPPALLRRLDGRRRTLAALRDGGLL